MIFSNITRIELRALTAVHTKALDELATIEKASAHGCKGCQRFAHSTNFCTHHKAPVPVEFHAQGCDDWTYDDIPF